MTGPSWPLMFAMLCPLLALPGCGSLERDDMGDDIATRPISGSQTGWVPVGRGSSGAIISDSESGWTPRTQMYPGDGAVVGTPGDPWAAQADDSAGPITLNLVNVSIQEAAKAILGDILKLNYFVDEGVSGTVTIETSIPMGQAALLDMFQSILQSKGAVIVASGGYYRIVSAGDRIQGASFAAGAEAATKPGVHIQMFPLQYVAAREMQRVLEPIAAKGAILNVDTTRNLLVLQGTAGELRTLGEAIKTFDVDWMQGMSFGLIPVTSSDPEAIAAELDTVFTNEKGGKGVVRFVPNRRLNSILVITARPVYLQRAETWVRRLDHAAGGSDAQLYVYHIQNRPAGELAKVLRGIFQGSLEEVAAAPSAVAPRFPPDQIATTDDAGGAIDVASSTDATATDVTGDQQSVSRAPDTVSGSLSDSSEATSRIQIVADEANNTLLIMASPRQYDKILRVLERIDAVPNQVLLEATIAEVSLNDELKFGLRWFFEQKNSQVTFTDAIAGIVAPQFPGFSYFLSAPHVDVALNALSAVTDVNVISTPTLMVLDNKTAVLQVGDQVPIATQSARSVTDPDAPIVNSVSFRDTGVILSVTPRVSDSGRVVLDIEQEVSDVVETTSSGIDSPTIQQRKIKTTVAVNDSEALALGGLIQESKNLSKNQVPVAGDIPILGNLFKEKDDKIRRTELIIIIRPHVVRDINEARWVTEEFRKQLNVNPGTRLRKRPGLRENADRILLQ